MLRLKSALLDSALILLPAIAPAQTAPYLYAGGKAISAHSPAEKSPQTVVAEYCIQVSDRDVGLEGCAFDRQGNLLLR
jgi:hypothetical protein